MNSVRIYLKYSVPLEKDRTRQSFPHECTQKYHRRRTGQEEHLTYTYTRHLRNYQGKGYLLHWQFQLRFGMLLANPPLYTANYKQITATDPQIVENLRTNVIPIVQQKVVFVQRYLSKVSTTYYGFIFIFSIYYFQPNIEKRENFHTFKFVNST